MERNCKNCRFSGDYICVTCAPNNNKFEPIEKEKPMSIKLESKCEFDNNGICESMVCYSSDKCGSRDDKGNPKYR